MVTDPAGNSATSAAIEVVVDNTAPVITIDQLTGGDSLSGSEVQNGFDITGAATEAIGQTITIDIFDTTGGGHIQLGSDLTGTVQANGTWAVSVPAAEAFLPNHSYSIEASSPSDDAGNPGSSVHGFVTDNTVPCFGRGTLILTQEGEKAIEALKIGNLVITAAGAARPIKWIGRRAYDPRFIAGNKRILPIRIEAGALAEGLPVRDLFVSPEHAMVIDGKFIPAWRLINGVTVHQVDAVERLEYFHVELDGHDVIFAEGTTAETFVDCGGRAMFHNESEFEKRYPAVTPFAWDVYSTLLKQGEAALPVIRAALVDRAVNLGRVSHDPDLHLIVDGEIVWPCRSDGRVRRFSVPAGAREVTIASRSVVPAETEANSLDPRRLGVPIEQIVLYESEERVLLGPDCTALHEGFHHDEGSHRWTDGRGKLPAELLDQFLAEVVVEVRIGATDLHYPTEVGDPRRSGGRTNDTSARRSRAAA